MSLKTSIKKTKKPGATYPGQLSCYASRLPDTIQISIMNSTQQTLTHYLTTFQSFNQGVTDYGLAPHKPLLVLSIIDALEQQNLITEKVLVDKRLKELFQRNWQLLVRTEHRCNINNPIFYLRAEGFWNAYGTDKEPLDKARGISKVSHGIIDDTLAELLQEPECRALFRTVILDRYFKDTKSNYQAIYPLPNIIQEIRESIHLRTGQDKKGKRISIFEGYFRNHYFRQDLLNLYDYSCCMSRLRTDPDIGIIEACHIEPQNWSGNSFITNGIPLCRNLHRAFDMGFLSIDSKYGILVKKGFVEYPSLYPIRELAGQSILLPQETKYYPSLEKLQAHRQRFGF